MQTCLLAALMCGAAARAEPVPMGRLFSTPAERAALDAGRNGGTPDGQPAAGKPEPAPAPLRLDGIVRRSSGKSTVWLNQVPQDDQRNTFLTARPGTLFLRAESGRKVILKPGQSYEPDQGAVREDYAR